MGQHWYCNKTGEPRYEIAYADGRPGKTPTLADAKKHDFVPSVTSVLGILDKPGLNNWKVDQAILAALTNPVIHDQMPHDQMMATIKRDAEEQSKQAMQRGTDIHAAIEEFLLGSPIKGPYWDHVSGVLSCLETHAGNPSWNVEHWLPGGLGYGGKCDLHNDDFLIDFKTKEFTSADVKAGKVKGWPEQEVQLVAYDHGFGGKRRRLANVFVSVTEPGLAVWYEWPAKGYDAALQKWQATLECWYAWKGYRPAISALTKARMEVCL